MLADTLRELRGELRAQKLRTALSLLGIGWGTMALLLLLAFSFGFEELFAERQRGLGDGIAIAWPERTTMPARGFPSGRELVVHRDDLLAVQPSLRHCAALSAEFAGRERITIGGTVLQVPISGVEPVFATLRSLSPQPGGRFPNDRDSALAARVVFLGDALARTLFPGQDPVGKALPLRGRSFTVVGVLQSKLQDSDYGGQDKDRAWIPATSFLQSFGRRPISNLVYRGVDPTRPEVCTTELVAALAARLQFDPADRAALSVWDTTEQQRMMYYIFLGFRLMLAIGGAFTLLVGGLGVGHLMQLMVRRRIGEIGLKLAVGAAPSRIRGEWLLQALVLVIAGAGGGALLALLAIVAVRASPATESVGRPFVPLPVAVATAALLAIVAFVAGYLPARRAAAMDPVVALRGGR